jgi:hypothetical protein
LHVRFFLYSGFLSFDLLFCRCVLVVVAAVTENGFIGELFFLDVLVVLQ